VTKKEKMTVLPGLLLPDILLISCCAASAALFTIALAPL
jgi:hypothetical protein